MNKSFFTFVNEYRINLACKYLIETNKQVSQIAYDCGYESLPFFYRQFQKFMGCSPLVFKKMY
ncbi:helix-turn-helix domain-containing protein [Lutibacter agarilyticus]|uniref:helix-turn-helix domain-containing protein n=1 Tax=Lutibacter agarilyticus TaxID=1109740 RepID=UPI000B779CE2